ncbi:hypothetical protein AVEN_46902-1 [Araneus ventricosus]|uniref:Uncharacterized protein n=1 Tax=Araneus ventricosus TaxID=182803 RepID=A0A4Y2CLT6_ARAVE|nr:hypothetical protein AVEN_46902-1 [Araneus ventricosus]
MASSVKDFRIVTPFTPSLFLIALVNVAFPFFKDYDPKTLDMAFTEIQQNLIKEARKSRGKHYNGARAYLLYIPGHLRKEVLEAVHSTEYEVMEWRVHLGRFFNIDDSDIQEKRKYIIYWRSDGTIDRIKTAQQLVMNASINIRKMFFIPACIASKKAYKLCGRKWKHLGKQIIDLK